MKPYIKLNDSDNYESINVYLSKDQTPIAYQNKLDELMECNCFETKDEAEQWINETPFELELYYEKNQGLFAVESEAVENMDTVHSPYSDSEILNEEQLDPDPESNIITDYHAEEKLDESLMKSIIILANDPSISNGTKSADIKAMIFNKLFNRKN